MSTARSVECRVAGPLAYLTLNRPPDNRLDQRMLSDLAQACQRIVDEPAVRVAILGASGSAFSLGLDNELLTAAQPPDFSPLASLAIPVIAAINGDALGAGLEIALCCDFRIVADHARFALPETSIGMIPSGGGTQRLPRLVGKGKALEMLLTAETIDASEALRIGLVNAVVPLPELEVSAERLAQQIATRAPIAVRYTKEVVRRGAEMTLEQGLRFEMDLNVLLQTTRDRAEGIKAFLEKRPPVFTGE